MSNKPKGTKGMELAQQTAYIKDMQDRLKVLRLEHELTKLTVEKLQYEEWLMKRFPEPAKTTEENTNTKSEGQDNIPGTEVDNKEA